jgi:hypothetical protein
MKFKYPKESLKKHHSIIERLLRGEFIFFGTVEYDILYEFEEWYRGFFYDSFKIDLQYKNEIFYTTSTNNPSKKTKNIMIFLAILMYELSKSGDDPVSIIHSKEFSNQEVSDIISNSTQFSDYFGDITSKFLNYLKLTGVIRQSGEDRFIFTKAIDIFLDEYEFLVEQLNLD